MHKIEGMVKWEIVYLIHIKNPQFCMVAIAIKQNLTRPWQKCMNIHHTNIHAPVVSNHGKLGPCPCPWRGGNGSQDHRYMPISG